MVDTTFDRIQLEKEAQYVQEVARDHISNIYTSEKLSEAVRYDTRRLCISNCTVHGLNWLNLIRCVDTLYLYNTTLLLNGEEIERFKHLQYLWLAHGRIDDINKLGEIRNLYSLVISGTYFSTLDWAAQLDVSRFILHLQQSYDISTILKMKQLEYFVWQEGPAIDLSFLYERKIIKKGIDTIILEQTPTGKRLWMQLTEKLVDELFTTILQRKLDFSNGMKTIQL